MGIAGYRLVEKDDFIRTGDVAGLARKYPIDMKLWRGSTAGEFNQPVFRPLQCYVDFYVTDDLKQKEV
jgi:hypothetical protein